jgi:hypothetical protein
MDKTIIFKIAVPTDRGFIGRECNNPECKKYFKIFTERLKDEMYCPYCGILFHKNDLHTKDQINYIKDVGIEEARACAIEMIDSMFKRVLTCGNGGR